MSDLKLDLPKSLALLGSESAANEIRAIGGLSAAAILLNGIKSSADPEVLNLIDNMLDHLLEQLDRVRELPAQQPIPDSAR